MALNGMIEIEIINACLSFGSKDATKMLNGIDSYCVVKMFGREIARTEVAVGTFDPIWHEKFPKALHELVNKEALYNRPFYLENIDIEVYDCSKSIGDKHVKIFETRVPIASIGLFKSYRLLKCSGSEGKESHDENRIFVRIGRVSNVVYDKVEHFKFQQLSNVCPMHCPLYRHLYMDFSWSPNAFTYNSGLPGPTRGELIVDRYYSVEWRVASGTNIFGDKLAVSCTGELLVTDLRVIFVPYEIHSPSLTWGAETVSLKDPFHFVHTEGRLSPAEILAIQRYTFQLPLSAIQECKIYQLAGSGTASASNNSNNTSAMSGMPSMPTLPNALGGFPGLGGDSSAGAVPTAAAWVLCLEGADGSSTEFIVKKHHGHRSHRKLALEFDRIHMSRIKDSQCKLDSALYRSGLDSYDIEPQVWCERVLDYLQWELKLDMVWIRWAKYLKRTCRQFTSQGAKTWLKKAVTPIDLDVDFQRLRVQDMDWRLSDLNGNYGLCPTYPSVLVFPGALQDEDIQGAAADRSIGRLPALVWLHPDTKAPLCRAAQPLSGMSGNTIEQDKRMCVAIKQSCPTGLPLRIADARPKLNANANAMQGKGFENISFLGGPAVASIVFMDIDNIHVVRHSLAKLRESLNTGSNTAADPSAGASSSANTADGSTVHASKWTSHISSILRGAAGVADSLMLGHPVLVHCSDGWDRTSQLTALSQLMIDPHYRTAEGFLSLLQKEWSSFGHKFEDRLGRRGHSKEMSPVCLQFLDCVWQMLRQFPTAFEFTGAFVTLVSQAMYSGLFVTFRRNSERERVHMMRTVGPYEDMQSDDFDFATLSAYVNLLLRTSNVSAMLLNASYLPPKASQKQVHYLRPSFGLHDLDLWKDGLCGINNNVHAASALSAPTVTAEEAGAMQRDLASRYAGYLELHMDHLPRHVQGKLELIRAASYPTNPAACPDAQSLSSCLATSGAATIGIPAGTTAAASVSSAALGSAEIRLQRSIFHHSAVLNPVSNVTRKLRSCWRKEEYDASFFDTLDTYRAVEAAVRLQTWARAVLVARKALKILELYIDEKGLIPPPVPSTAEEAGQVDVGGWVVKRKAHLRRSLYSARPQSYFRVFYILAASQVRTALRDKEQQQRACADFMHNIIDDALEQAMVYCIRNDNYQLAYAYRRSAVADASELGFNPAGNSRGSSDFSKSSADKKSLSSRIFGGLVATTLGSSKGDASPGNSTNTASASAAALAGEGNGGTSPMRASGRYDPVQQQGSRSYSPKPPTLMGRLLGK